MMQARAQQVGRCGRLARAAALGAAALTVPVPAGATDAGGPDAGRGFVLLDSGLKMQHAASVRLEGEARSGGVVKFVDDKGEAHSRKMGEVVALLPPWWEPTIGARQQAAADGDASDGSTGGRGVGGGEVGGAGGPPVWGHGGMLELTDGQRFAGHLGRSGSNDPPDLVTWEHPSLGRLVVKLDDVRRIDLMGPPPPRDEARESKSAPGAPAGARGVGGAGATDEIEMVNGDRVRGLVEHVGGPGGIGGATVEIEVDGRKVETPIGQVARVRLVNDRKPPQGMRVWLGDGTEAAVARFVPGGDGAHPGGTWGVELGGPAKASGAASLDADAVVAVSFDASRVVALASLEVVKQEPVGGRRRADGIEVVGSEAFRWNEGGAPLGAADVELPGPMAVEWALPAGAERVAGWLQMPRESWEWGDCDVTISVAGLPAPAGGALVSEEVSGTRPLVAFNAALPPAGAGGTTGVGAAGEARLRVVMDAGKHGPIQDRVMLRRVVVLVGRGGQ